MPKYRYTATDAAGKTVRGVAEAADEETLYNRLRTEGKFVVEQKETTGADRGGGRPLKTGEIADFCRQLGTLLSAGVPMVRAFAIMAQEQGLDPRLKTLYDGVQADIRKGTPLSDAMEDQGAAFPELLVGMIRSAEGTGSIDRSAMRMANHYTKEHKLQQEVSNSMMYPAILAVLLVFVVIFLLSYVVPQFQTMFDAMPSLPWPTTLLLGMSSFVKHYWLGLGLGIAGAVAVARILLRLPAVRLATDKLKLHLPVIGKLQRKICTARFARTLSNLYSSGVPIVASLKSGRDTVGNTYIASQFDEVLAQVRAGSPLSEALGSVDGFERKLASAVMVGEETGKLDDMLASISDSMDYEAEMATKKMMTLLEPVMIIVMAVVVAFVIIAVILPIYQSYSTIGGSNSAI